MATDNLCDYTYEIYQFAKAMKKPIYNLSPKEPDSFIKETRRGEL